MFESVEHAHAQCPFENRCARVCCCCDVIGIGGLSILQGSRASRHPALFFVRFVVNLSLIEWQNIEVLPVCTVLYPCCLSARSKEVFTSHSSLVCPSRLASLGLTTQWFKIPSSPPMKEAVLWKLLSPHYLASIQQQMISNQDKQKDLQTKNVVQYARRFFLLRTVSFATVSIPASDKLLSGRFQTRSHQNE